MVRWSYLECKVSPEVASRLLQGYAMLCTLGGLGSFCWESQSPALFMSLVTYFSSVHMSVNKYIIGVTTLRPPTLGLGPNKKSFVKHEHNQHSERYGIYNFR